MAKTLNDLVAEAQQNVREISVQELPMLQQQGTRVLDVREQDEFDAGHVPGAYHSPRGFLEVRADHSHPKRDETLADRDQPLAILCAGGIRSLLAAQTLQEMGFTNVVSVKGGFSAYNEAGLAVERS